MVKKIQYLLVIFFILFLCSVGLNLIITGKEDSGFEKKKTLPKWTRLFKHENKYRDQLSDYLHSNYWIRNQSVKYKNKADLYMGGGITTDKVFSANDGFFFYREQFERYPCDLSDEKITNALEQMNNLQNIAQMADIRLDITLSPDKSVIYPEKLNDKTKYYWKCRLDRANELRKQMDKYKDITDYAKVVLPLKEKTKYPIYYKMDTHWSMEVNSAVSKKTTADILAMPYDDIPDIQLKDTYHDRLPDMAMMLKFDHKPEKIRDADASRLSEYIDQNMIDQNIMIIHDSFFGRGRNIAKDIFAQKDNILVTPLGSNIYKDIYDFRPQIIYYNSVERSFIRRAPIFGNKSELYRYILSEHHLKSQSCQGEIFQNIKLDYKNINHDQNNLFISQSKDPQIFIDLPEFNDHICLSVNVEPSQNTNMEVFYIPEHKENFTSNYKMIYPIKKEENQIDFVLPQKFSGKKLRIDPVHGKVDFGFDINIKKAE